MILRRKEKYKTNKDQKNIFFLFYGGWQPANWCITTTYCSGVCIRQFTFKLNPFTHKHQPTHIPFYPDLNHTLWKIPEFFESSNSTLICSLLPMLNNLFNVISCTSNSLILILISSPCAPYSLHLKTTCSTDSSFSQHPSHKPVWCFPTIFRGFI